MFGLPAKTECMSPSINYEVRCEPILFHNLLWNRVEPVASTFRPASCIYSWLYLVFKLRKAVKHMSPSFSFKHIAAEVKKMVDMASFSVIFRLRLLSQSFYMLASTRTPWFVWTNAKKAWKHRFSVNFDNFVVVSYSYADSVAVCSNHFLLVECLFDAKVLLNGHSVTQNCFFVVFQSEAIEKTLTTSWSDTLKRQKSRKFLCNLGKTSIT